MKGSSREKEDIGKLKCRIRSRVDIIIEAVKVSSGEQEDIGIRKCTRGSRVDIINEELKGWTSLSKQQKVPPEPRKTKEKIRLEHTKEKV